jgi:hypothetical protein
MQMTFEKRAIKRYTGYNRFDNRNACVRSQVQEISLAALLSGPCPLILERNFSFACVCVCVCVCVCLCLHARAASSVDFRPKSHACVHLSNCFFVDQISPRWLSLRVAIFVLLRIAVTNPFFDAKDVVVVHTLVRRMNATNYDSVSSASSSKV